MTNYDAQTKLNSDGSVQSLSVTINGSKPGTAYRVQITKDFQECGCKAFLFSNDRNCKHARELRKAAIDSGVVVW